MKVITRKVFSVCDDFSEELAEDITCERGPDCYIEYTANSREYFENSKYDVDEIAIRLFELGAEENEKVLIEIDY